MRKLSFYSVVFFLTFIISCKEKKAPLTAQTESSAAQKRPNILILLADDLGYGELGSYGQETIETPVLDSLARIGMRFTNFYAGSPVCSPSRAVLMTGIKSSNNTIRGNRGRYPDGSQKRVALNSDDITLGEMFGNAGYQTAFIGKWHLDVPDDISTWAHARGFQYAVQEQWTGKGKIDFDSTMEYVNGMQDSIDYDYTKWESHDDFRTHLAFDYLDTELEENEPFFLFMSYRAPHGHEYVIGNDELYMDKGWPAQERLHAAKITLLDRHVGRLLKKLEDIGELENTLILFTSDNGPHQEGNNHDPEYFDSNGALKGIKRDLYEGGIRVPMIAYWKDKIESGSTNDNVYSAQDIMPTLAEATGITAPTQTNGTSMLPALLGRSQKERPYVNWEFIKNGEKDGFRQSVRIGNLKGVRYTVDAPTELYNLETDLSETENIASEHPEVIEKINTIFKKDRTDNPHYPYGGSTEMKTDF